MRQRSNQISYEGQTLYSFGVYYDGDFKFWARSKSEKKLAASLAFLRGWDRKRIKLVPGLPKADGRRFREC